MKKINKKIIIILIILVVIIFAGVFIYKDFIKIKSEPSLNNGQINIGNNSVQNLEEKNQGIINKLVSPSLDRQVVFPDTFPIEERASYTQKIQDLAEKLKKEISDYDAWIAMGNYRKIIEDYEGARQAWEFAGLLAPKNSISFNNLGDLYGYYLKNYPESEKNYLKAIENNALFSPAYLGLADIYWDGYKAKQSEIESLLLKGIKVVSGNDKINLMARLARYYKDIGDKVNAIKYYEEILKLDPKNTSIQEEIDNLNH